MIEPKISVIVAAYNVEAYLRKCVDSILAQTYKNLEVLLVDDGSPDLSGAICDEYVRKDARVKAISTMLDLWNAKVGAERFYNVAMAIVNGELIPEYDEGPMSRAQLLKNNWFHDDTV